MRAAVRRASLRRDGAADDTCRYIGAAPMPYRRGPRAAAAAMHGPASLLISGHAMTISIFEDGIFSRRRES